MQKRWLGFFGIVMLIVAAVAFNRYYLPGLAYQDNAADSVGNFSLKLNEPSVLYGMVVDDFLVIEDKIKRNERLGDILLEYNVPARLIHQVSQVSRNIFDVRKIVPNKKYTLICNQDSLKTAQAFVYEPNPIDYIVFRFGDSLTIDVCKRDVVTVEKGIAGEIRSNLSETIEELGISHELTNKFVDIFAWQVDFARLQKGDKFKLIYEESQVEGVTVSIDKIKAIYFEHVGSPYYAFPLDQGDGVDFFDQDGKSLRKALLKYPIEFTRISSRYTMSRFHPVQKRWKAHLGTDFAAPTGTPIRSVGDGTIEEAQYKSNNGNYVKIRHNGTYTTQYLHMSRIADGVRAGTRVRQGQTIGYVGSTGLATGPHLCYRFWKNGVQVDALRIDLPPSEPVKKAYESQFETIKQDLTNRLQAIPFPDQNKQEPIAAL
ncbi:M23 family metallopeptidase [Parachryseolinea silvisoli]|uniref:M23 family metallopeptidase n=1 Tax=Parachryseolinea silvisoli TaxID=2873601 RepID=UPI002265B4AC|nr:peptidoglycan DD-metalloendopeptidase family protein [Parachryseolinea silvisoli]MCD9016298.1 peptidoglycan DD-metalloendopeptidase family protein [Parachryseolinea silvisoli]